MKISFSPQHIAGWLPRWVGVTACLVLGLAHQARAIPYNGDSITGVRINDYNDFGCSQSPGGAGAPTPAANNAGDNNSSCPTCPGSGASPNGMPRWWIDEPYINIHVVDEPISYTTSSGQPMDFRIYYKYDFTLPGEDQVPNFYADTIPNGYGPRYTDATHVEPYVYWSRQYGGPSGISSLGGMTNGAWTHNWQEYIVLWDYDYEVAYYDHYILGYPSLPPIPFSDGYEALAFMPSGGTYYFTSNATNETINPPTQTANPTSQVQFSSFPLSYPSPTNGLSGADSHGIYWGNPTNGLALTYPDGSKDIFGLFIWGNPAGLTTTGAFLTQKIDPQGRVTRLGYTNMYVINACDTVQSNNMFALAYVVDPDGRTNTFVYNSSAPNENLELQAINDPFGRSATFGYQSCVNFNDYPAGTGWLIYSIDAQGNSNAFKYSTHGGVTGSSYLSDIITPYGTTAFYYSNIMDTTVTSNFALRAAYVTEPDGASQLFCYYHNTTNLIPNSLTPPSVSGGWVFDNGTTGNAAEPLCLRNSFYWGRQQMATMTNTHLLDFLTLNPALAISDYATTDDLQKARLRHWLLDTDGISLTETLSSEQDPSPANSGAVPGARTWHAYTNASGSANVLSTPQTGSIAQILPDGTAQSTLYGYYSTGLVSSNVQSLSLSGGGVGQLTNSFTYAANGIDLTAINNSLGQYLDIGYNANHEPIAMTNAGGQITTFSYNATSQNLSGITFGNGQTVSLNYYPSNTTSTGSFVSNITVQPEGRTTYFVNYTAALPQIVHVTGTSVPDLWLTNTWDNLNRLTDVQFQDGTSISNFYTNLDVRGTKDRLGNWTYFDYDGLQHLVTITNALTNITQFTWCSCGSLTSISNTLGNITDLNYNNQSLLTNIDFPDGSSITYQYDLSQRLTNLFDGAGNSQQFIYNNANQVVAIKNAYGQLFGAYFDAVGRPVWLTNANGVAVSNSFDLINRLASRNWLGGGSEYFGYATNGLIAYTNQDSQWTHYGLDNAGRILALTNAVQTISFAYDALDDLISLTDGLSHTTTWGFNQFGWLTQKNNTSNTTMIVYSYDADGRVTNRWMAGTNTGYKFDAVGNLTNINYPANTVSFGYDVINELTSMADQVGTTTFTWTSNSQLATETSPWATNTVSYGYNQGHRTSLTLTQPSGSWSQTYGYDNAWRMTSITSPAGTFDYAYPSPTNQYRVGSISLPNGASVLNQYDSLSRMTSTALMNFWGHTLDGYVYGLDALGLRTNMIRQLGLATNTVSIGYDPIDELASWTAKETNGTSRLNEQLGYGYDAGNNLNLRTNNALVQTFTVNSLNQLNTVTRTGTLTVSGALPEPANSVTINGGAAQTYADFTYAATNNTLSNGTNTFTIVAENVYNAAVTNTLVVNLPSTVNFQYDNNGNLTNDGTRIFTYDSENRLANVLVTGQYQTVYVYDGLSRLRIMSNYIWQSGAWAVTNVTRYICDGMVVLQERNTNNTPMVTYTRGLDLSTSLAGAGGIGGLLARTDANGPTFYHADGSGNITGLMDTNANMVARYEYDGFGKRLAQSGSMASANEMGFSSMPTSPNGIIGFPFRFYEPNFGRWLNRDPIQELGGINLYQAIRNNPLQWVDPLGLDNMYNMAAGNNAPPSMTITGSVGGGTTPTIAYQGGQGDPFLMMMATSTAGTTAAAVVYGAIRRPDIVLPLVANILDDLRNQQTPGDVNSLPANKQQCPSALGTNTPPMIAGLKQIGTGKAQQFDVHGFKESIVGQENVSKFNVSVDTDTGKVVLTPRNPGSSPNVETEFESLSEAMEAFPLEP
jgi:RHS repeat-associated protein